MCSENRWWWWNENWSPSNDTIHLARHARARIHRVAPRPGRAAVQDDFPAEEFVQRRARVMDAIGTEAIAIVQGAPGVDGFKVYG
jgi:hypothetical protein